MSTLQEAVRLSQEFHWGVLPLRPKEKVSYIKWEELQQRHLTSVEIFQLWAQFPDANLGVILGEISGIAQIDCDDSSAVDFIKPYIDGMKVPTVQTRRGLHYYFKVDADLRTAKGNLHPKLEYRTRGHVAVVPPSIRSDGEAYQWLVTVEDCGGVPELPAKLKGDLKAAQEAKTAGYIPPETCAPYQFGRRDDDLFHTAYTLIRGGMDVAMATDALRRIVSTMDQRDMPNLDVKIASAMKRALGKGGRNISQDVRDWLEHDARGSFSTQEMYNALGLHSIEDQRAARTELHRICEDGKIAKRNQFRNGFYEALAADIPQPMDWQRAECRPLDLKLPLLLNTVFEVYPKNLIVVASPPDMGKTVFLQNVIKANMNTWDVVYQNCEMSPEELHRRLRAHEDVTEWRMTVYERSANFAALIKPDALNVIDYLEIPGDQFWKINIQLAEIHAKLRGGVAVIGLQKSYFSDMGRGAEFGMERPRLYLTMQQNVARIVKCKNRPIGAESAWGKILEYHITGGWNLVPEVSEWHQELADEHKKHTYDKPIKKLF